jgi:hypothetical protein
MGMGMSELRAGSDEEIAGLLSTVAEIREAGFPGLDEGLVGEILDAHRRHAEDRAEARKLTEQLVNRWVATHVKSGGHN